MRKLIAFLLCLIPGGAMCETASAGVVVMTQNLYIGAGADGVVGAIAGGNPGAISSAAPRRLASRLPSPIHFSPVRRARKARSRAARSKPAWSAANPPTASIRH